MKTKVIVFDSSTIITLSMNGMLDILRKLKESFSGKFIIPNAVKFEIVERPKNIKRFKWHALKVEKLFKESIFENPESLGISNDELNKRKNEIIESTNNLFYAGRKPIKMIDYGEAECLAVCTILDEKEIENVLAIDERTTRVLGENPNNLKKLLENKLHTAVIKKKDLNFPKISKIKFIRSSELVYVAYKKGFILPKERDVLDAALYATKFKGSAISGDEIKQIKSLA